MWALGNNYFSETEASRSTIPLSILKRSFRASENERAIVLGMVLSNLKPGNGCFCECINVRLRSVIGLPVTVHLIVRHDELQ